MADLQAAELIKRTHVYKNGEYVETVYVHQDYPKFKHHASEAPILVRSEEEEMALGDGWADNPLEHGIITAPDEAELNRRKVAQAQAGSNWKAALAPRVADLSERHVAFLQAHGRNDILTVEQAHEFVSKLTPAQQQSFLNEAAAWKEVKQQKEKK